MSEMEKYIYNGRPKGWKTSFWIYYTMRLNTQRPSQPSNSLRTHPSSFVIYTFTPKAQRSAVASQTKVLHSDWPVVAKSHRCELVRNKLIPSSELDRGRGNMGHITAISANERPSAGQPLYYSPLPSLSAPCPSIPIQSSNLFSKSPWTNSRSERGPTCFNIKSSIGS